MRFQSIVPIIFAGLLTVSSCVGDASDADQPYSSTLLYFGYYRDSDFGSHQCQIQDHANFSMTSSEGDPAFGWDATVPEAAYGIHDFGVIGNDPLGGYLARDDAEQGAWRYCSTNPCPNGAIDGWNVTKAEIEAYVAQGQSRYPNVHGFINFSRLVMEIPGTITLPSNVEWYGLECYDDVATCQRLLDFVASRPGFGNGRFWILTLGTCDSGSCNEPKLVADAYAFYNWAKTDPRIIGMMPFLWQSSCDANGCYKGVEDLPSLKQAYRQIGDEITGRGGVDPIADCSAPPPPPPPPPGGSGHAAALRERIDFDGDGRSDHAYYFPPSTSWQVVQSSSGSAWSYAWGSEGARPVPGDYDGDGKTDVAFYFPSTLTWHVVHSSTGQPWSYPWGSSGAIPAPGDYDGDGKTDIAYYFPPTTTWYAVLSSTGNVWSYAWGIIGAVPVPADYDGDGKTDVAYYYPGGTTWYVVLSSTGQAWSYIWGVSGAIPVPGDYDGDGRTDVAYYYPPTTTWYVVQSSSGSAWSYAWGSDGAIPTPGDYDGDGKTDVAYYFPPTTTWHVVQSSSGSATSYAWGSAGAIPLASILDPTPTP